MPIAPPGTARPTAGSGLMSADGSRASGLLGEVRRLAEDSLRTQLVGERVPTALHGFHVLE